MLWQSPAQLAACERRYSCSSSRFRLSGSGVSSPSSSKSGSETTYFSEAQFPRSKSRQRSLQKGKSRSTSESTGLRQMGQLCFMAAMTLLWIKLAFVRYFDIRLKRTAMPGRAAECQWRFVARGAPEGERRDRAGALLSPQRARPNHK